MVVMFFEVGAAGYVICCRLEMRFYRSIAFRLPKRLRQGGARTLYPWLGLAAAILGSIATGLTWFAVSHRESELAKLELSSQGSGYALTLQFGIDAYLRKVPDCVRCSIRRTMSVADSSKNSPSNC
jgi:hypothetical protein